MPMYFTIDISMGRAFNSLTKLEYQSLDLLSMNSIKITWNESGTTFLWECW